VTTEARVPRVGVASATSTLEASCTPTSTPSSSHCMSPAPRPAAAPGRAPTCRGRQRPAWSRRRRPGTVPVAAAPRPSTSPHSVPAGSARADTPGPGRRRWRRSRPPAPQAATAVAPAAPPPQPPSAPTPAGPADDAAAPPPWPPVPSPAPSPRRRPRPTARRPPGHGRPPANGRHPCPDDMTTGGRGHPPRKVLAPTTLHVPRATGRTGRAPWPEGHRGLAGQVGGPHAGVAPDGSSVAACGYASSAASL
jgi:hypothetical protein